MASRFFFEWITLGSYLSRAPASARLLFLLHCTHRYNPPVCNPRIIMTNFTRIERLPPSVFNITGELIMAARRSGEAIIDMSMGNSAGTTPKQLVNKLVEDASRRAEERHVGKECV